MHVWMYACIYACICIHKNVYETNDESNKHNIEQQMSDPRQLVMLDPKSSKEAKLL